MSSKNRDLKKLVNRPILCRKCGLAGGTLMKIDTDHYEHQDKVRCQIAQSRKKADLVVAKGGLR